MSAAFNSIFQYLLTHCMKTISYWSTYLVLLCENTFLFAKWSFTYHEAGTVQRPSLTISNFNHNNSHSTEQPMALKIFNVYMHAKGVLVWITGTASFYFYSAVPPPLTTACAPSGWNTSTSLPEKSLLPPIEPPSCPSSNLSNVLLNQKIHFFISEGVIRKISRGI